MHRTQKNCDERPPTFTNKTNNKQKCVMEKNTTNDDLHCIQTNNQQRLAPNTSKQQTITYTSKEHKDLNCIISQQTLSEK